MQDLPIGPPAPYAAPGSRNTVPGVTFQTSRSYFILRACSSPRGVASCPWMEWARPRPTPISLSSQQRRSCGQTCRLHRSRWCPWEARRTGPWGPCSQSRGEREWTRRCPAGAQAGERREGTRLVPACRSQLGVPLPSHWSRGEAEA